MFQSLPRQRPDDPKQERPHDGLLIGFPLFIVAPCAIAAWLWTVGFPGITYLPLQCVVLWKCRGAARAAAALPLLFMVPMIIAGLQPSAYHSGSLYGMFFICPYLPAMIYLVAVLSAGPRVPKVCPHCGHKTRVKSFQMTRSSTLCAKCGQDVLGDAAGKPNSMSNGGGHN